MPTLAGVAVVVQKNERADRHPLHRVPMGAQDRPTMAKSKLTPDDRARIVARYVETTNASQVAQEFKVDEKTVRNVLAALDAPKRSELHAQACARGIRDGRRALSKTSKRLQAWLEKLGNPDAPGMEPGDLAKIASSLRGVVSGLVEVDEHRAKVKLSRLTRDLRRAEIELARLKIKAGGVDQHQHSLVASVVVLPELDDGADGSVAPESGAADAGAEEHRG
jgi:transposase-like protein